LCLPNPVSPLLQSHTRVRYSSFTFKTKGIVRKYCTGTNVILNPWFVTGLSDAYVKKGIKHFNTKSPNNPLSLVVWGTNLTSQVGKGRFSKQVAKMIILPPYQNSVIIGLLFSDGWLTIASKTHKNARLGFKQSLSHANYVWFVFNEFSHYCSSYTQLTKGIRSGNRFYGLQFFTRGFPCFTELHSLFYPAGVKRIPENIYELLTPIALAHVIMGDGLNELKQIVLGMNSYRKF
jgi:hypothetical protein